MDAMKNPAVDAYIAKAAPFARPILRKIRALFHQACPGIEEKLKWGCPSFERGRIIGIMAAFKAHCRLVLWRDVAAKITKVSQLPSAAAFRAAVAAQTSGARSLPPRKPKPPLKVPPYFRAALRKDRRALATFEAFPPSHRREYVEWVVDAKTAETRARRLATAVDWMSQGKPRNWKYLQRDGGRWR
jgi:hypothetical protein